MAIRRDDPYGNFNYRVVFTVRSGIEIRGAFSDISGLSTEITYADYREGTDPRNHGRKLPQVYKNGDVTLKRGVIAASDLYAWVEQIRAGVPNTRATVRIELLDEGGANTVATWVLEGARPSKLTGPTLAAKGGTDVAMEELVLVVEDMTFE